MYVANAGNVVAIKVHQPLNNMSNLTLLQALLDAGADVDASRRGKTAFNLAAEGGCMQSVDLLYKATVGHKSKDICSGACC